MPKRRRTARVILFDEVGAILMIRFALPMEGGDFVFWGLPGGQIEAGETEHAAAVREVKEELGLDLSLTGPVYHDRNVFVFEGETHDNLETLFRAECRRQDPELRGASAEEVGYMKEMRWWTAEEIAGSGERFFPENLASRVREQSGEVRRNQD